jgi:hypothetical protein
MFILCSSLTLDNEYCQFTLCPKLKFCLLSKQLQLIEIHSVQ